LNNLKIIGSEEWCSFESFKIPAINPYFGEAMLTCGEVKQVIE
jgi:hypothetical protein